MKYSRVYIDAIGYELPPVVVTSAELEARLGRVYEALAHPRRAARGAHGDHRAAVVGPGLPALARGRSPRRGTRLRRRRSRPDELDVADLRRGLPRAVRAGDGLPGRRRDRRRARRRGLRHQQRLPRRAQRHGRRRQPDRAGPDPRGVGRLVRDRPRDQRHRHRGDAPVQDDGSVRVLAGHADRRLGGGRRAVDRRLVLRLRGGDGCSAGSLQTRPAVPRALPLGDRGHHAQARGVPAVRGHRLGRGAQARRRARSCGPGRPSSASSAGSANRSTRSSATRSARGTSRRSSRRSGSTGKRNSPPIPTWATSAPSRSP